MKKTRITLIFTVLIALVCILTACSPKTAKLTDIFNDDPVEGYAPVYTSANLIDFSTSQVDLTHYDFIEADGIFASFGGTFDVDGFNVYKYYIYNMVEGTLVSTKWTSDPDTVRYDFDAIETREGHYVYVLYTYDLANQTVSTGLNTDYGYTIVEKDAEIVATYNKDANHLEFDDHYFYVNEDGTLSNDCVDIKTYINKGKPEINGSSENYFYYIDEKEAYVYSRNYELIGAYILPSYATSLTDTYFHILDNGNLFVQYLIEEPTDSQDYNLLFEGEKSTLITQIINVKKGTTKEIDFGYLVLSAGDTSAFVDNLNEKLVNIAVAVPVENRRLSLTNSNIQYLSMDNNGNIKYILNDTIPAQGWNLPQRIANDRYLLTNDLGTSYILDKKGNTVTIVSDMEDLTKFAYISNDNIINFNGETMLSLSNEDNNSLIAVYDGCYIYENNDTAVTWLLTSAGETSLGYYLSDKINTDSPYFFYYKAFNVDHGCWQHLFYNVNGNLIGSVYNYTSVETVCYSEDGNYAILLFSNESTGAKDFYRFSV